MLPLVRALILPVLIISSIAGSTPAADFQAGVAVVDITPPQGYRMSGYFNERLNTGTHDPLQAKAVVFRQGNQQAALVFCDLIGISRSVTGRAREQAAQKTGIPATNILIHGTHSHTGPLYDGASANTFTTWPSKNMAETCTKRSTTPRSLCCGWSRPFRKHTLAPSRCTCWQESPSSAGCRSIAGFI